MKEDQSMPYIHHSPIFTFGLMLEADQASAETRQALEAKEQAIKHDVHSKEFSFKEICLMNGITSAALRDILNEESISMDILQKTVVRADVDSNKYSTAEICLRHDITEEKLYEIISNVVGNQADV